MKNQDTNLIKLHEAELASSGEGLEKNVEVESTETAREIRRAKLAKLQVRKGTGITGKGAKNVSPHLSGRLTMGMLNKMIKAR